MQLIRKALIACAGLAFVCASPARAIQLSNGFNVTVKLQPPQALANTGLCKSTNAPGAFGATVTIVCATGAIVDLAPANTRQPYVPTHGGAFRYVTQVSNGSGLLGTVDVYSGLGTITTWRVISHAGQEYVEMTLGW
jgi:hypothetical protein